jgi:MoaA/NifB/PqqE/SkfB family radical SAM enzyme
LFTKFCKEKLPKCKIGFTTNGYYLDQNIADELKNYGVDAINISLYTHQEAKRLQKIIFNIPVEFRDYTDLVNQDDRLKYYTESNSSSSRCLASAPLSNIAINHNGDVCLCCIDWQYRYTFGNVLHESLMTIINKQNFLQAYESTGLGKSEFVCCKHCNGQYMVKLPDDVYYVCPEHTVKEDA